ncbi:hypothetical protein, partial [Actinophytocola sp.]|uniref:hypothetical protein n=1 Tax=Actinophytocola sp. TaxID=1872138 RepID=UPI002D800E14
SNYLEFGLIDIRLGQAGIREPVYSRLESIRASNAESRTAHLEILDRLLEAMLGESADRVIQEEELRAIGVEPTPPDPGDYDF